VGGTSPSREASRASLDVDIPPTASPCATHFAPSELPQPPTIPARTPRTVRGSVVEVVLALAKLTEPFAGCLEASRGYG